MKNLRWFTPLKNSINLYNNHSIFKFILKSAAALSVITFILLSFSGCEENMWLRSEKKLRNQIQGTWNRLSVTGAPVGFETWTFKDGTLAIVETEVKSNNTDNGYDDLNDSDGSDTISIDYGNYSVDAKIDNAYLRLSNFEENTLESAKQGLNAKWTIVDIDGSILYIAAENGSAVIQREFEKKN